MFKDLGVIKSNSIFIKGGARMKKMNEEKRKMKEDLKRGEVEWYRGEIIDVVQQLKNLDYLEFIYIVLFSKKGFGSMGYKRDIMKFIAAIDEEKEEIFLSQILIMIKTHLVGRR